MIPGSLCVCLSALWIDHPEGMGREEMMVKGNVFTVLRLVRAHRYAEHSWELYEILTEDRGVMWLDVNIEAYVGFRIIA